MSIHLCYDGSINADWVTRYAVCFARHQPDRRLRVVHVETGELPSDLLKRKLKGLEKDARAAGVTVGIDTVPVRGTVAATLATAIPEGPDVFVICGTRARGGRHGFLSGTVTEKLLTRQASNVMAMRVVQPGLLGVAHSILLTVTDIRTFWGSALPFLDLMVPEVKRVHILNAVKVRRLTYRHMTQRRLSKLRAKGFAEAREAERTVMEKTGLTDPTIDSSVRVTDDWVMETIILASRHKSQLICLQVPRRSLKDRLPFANPIERMLRDTPCDVALFSKAEGLD